MYLFVRMCCSRSPSVLLNPRRSSRLSLHTTKIMRATRSRPPGDEDESTVGEDWSDKDEGDREQSDKDQRDEAQSLELRG
jgi:hypothetical protein